MKKQTLVIILIAMLVVSCLALTACHEHEFGQWTVVSNATCTDAGLKERICECGEKEKETIPATGVHLFNEWTVVTEPTCTQSGKQERTCACGRKETETVAATGHTFGEWTVVTEATCVQKGREERVCTCGKKETRSVDLKSHTEGEWIIDSPLTCTQDFSRHQVCAVCGITMNTESVTAPGHSYDSIVTNPTCTEQGYITHTCSVCGDSYIDTYTNVLGHTEGEWIIDVEATCTEAGSKHQVCATCEVTINTSVIQPLGQHSLTTALSDKLRVTCTYCDYSDEYDLAIDTNKLYGLNQFKQNDNEDFYNFYIDLYNAATIFANCQDDLVEENDEYVIAKIDTQSYTLSDLELMSVWKIFYMENPQFYWLTNTVDFYDNGFLLLADEAYSKYEDRARYDLLISDMLADAAKSIAFAKNELEVVFNLHDFILSNNEYAYIEGTLAPETEIWAHNLVGFAEKNKGVCEAYAKTFLYFSYIFDINNIIVTGQSKGEKHGWNLVEIDGNWYYFDFTWDDRESEGIAYNYFGLCALTMQKDHTNDTTSNEGFGYLYNLPDALAEIELVRLYQNGVDIGLRTSIDNAIDSMTDADSEYEIELFRYDYLSLGGVAAFVDKVHHISKDLPNVKQVTIAGVKQDLGDNGFFSSFMVSTIDILNNFTLHSNLILNNVSLGSDGNIIDLADYSLILEGYYNSIGGKIIGSENAWLIVNTQQESEIYAAVDLGNVSIKGESCDFFGTVIEISNLYLSQYSEFYIRAWAQDVIIENIHNGFATSMTVCGDSGDTNVSIGNIESDLFIRVIFDDVAHYPNISFVGELNGDITFNLDGNLTFMSIDLFTGETQIEHKSVKPMQLIGKRLFVANEENVDKVKLIFNFNYIDHSDLCVMNDDGEVYFDLPEADQDGFVIKDNVLIGYVGNSATVVIPEGVTSIESEAFAGIKTIYQVVLPSTLTHIEDGAFNGCSKLVEVVNNSQLDIKCGTRDFGSVAFNAFSVTKEAGYFTVIQDKFLFYLGEVNYLISYFGTDETVILPQTEFEYHINRYAFYQNTTMKYVDLGEKVVSIGDSAFYMCELLEEIYIPANIKQIEERAFFLCILLRKVTFDPNSSLTSIASGMFMACSNLTTVILPNSVMSIGDYAFSDCTHLTNIILPNSVTGIGGDAFNRCENLESITIPSSVTSIGVGAFRDCYSLTAIIVDKDNPNYQSIDGNLYSKDGKTLVQYAIGKTDASFEVPETVTSIGEAAFYGCTSLTSITMLDGVTSIGVSAFFGCTNLTSVIMSKNVTSIGTSAFQDCASLTDITIPSSVTNIDAFVFNGCTSLTNIILPDGIEYIGSFAFNNCSNLKSITIPDSVTSISDMAFSDCTLLANVYYAGTEEQWNNISIGTSNEYLTTATIHFNYTGEEN
ncbi:MAG: leucine-rich repeat protein [Clostridia bacterium]|nr:leucine-rich repeat protein [Clostridia bacterium]